jgi:uncharacterized membrane protein
MLAAIICWCLSWFMLDFMVHAFVWECSYFTFISFLFTTFMATSGPTVRPNMIHQYGQSRWNDINREVPKNSR